MNNPILDEIPDAFMSEEMQEKITEEAAQNMEIRLLRDEVSSHYVKEDEYLLEVIRRADRYFQRIPSRDILGKFLTHFVAYHYCIAKVRKEIRVKNIADYQKLP